MWRPILLDFFTRFYTRFAESHISSLCPYKLTFVFGKQNMLCRNKTLLCLLSKLCTSALTFRLTLRNYVYFVLANQSFYCFRVTVRPSSSAASQISAHMQLHLTSRQTACIVHVGSATVSR